MKNLILGFVFAMLWASAGVASKFGIQASQPLVFSNIRFIVAGIILLSIALLSGRKIGLTKAMFWQCAVYGLLNVAIYLGVFIYAIKYVSAGISGLAISINPLFISVLSVFFLKTKITGKVWLALFLGLLGVGIAAFPLLKTSYAEPIGLLFLTISMLSYSLGTIFYIKKTWPIDPLVLNGWQVFFGGLIILPFSLYLYEPSLNHFNLSFWGSLSWLIFMVSIFTVQIWLYLLKIDPEKSSLWLFLCPIFGFIYASIILNEPISIYTFIGTGVVLLALCIGQWEKIKLAIAKF